MIEFSIDTDHRPERYFQYFSGDGSWGTTDDIVIVDVTELDSHFSEFIDEVNDWQRPDFMRWYVDNQTHDQDEHSYTACRVCEQWDSGLTEDEIITELESEEE